MTERAMKDVPCAVLRFQGDVPILHIVFPHWEAVPSSRVSTVPTEPENVEEFIKSRIFALEVNAPRDMFLDAHAPPRAAAMLVSVLIRH